MDEMMQGLTKHDVCYCKETGVHNTVEKGMTVKPTMFYSINDSKNSSYSRLDAEHYLFLDAGRVALFVDVTKRGYGAPQ